MNKLKLTLMVVLMAIITNPVFGQEKIERTFSGIKSIRLETASGNGEIVRGKSNEVKVTVEFTYDEDDYKPEFEQNGDKLYIKEEFKRSRYNNRGYSEWTLEIPDGLELDFKTGSGNIEVDGLTIELDVISGSGNLELSDLNGDVSAKTGSGNIELDKVEGETYVRTGSGSIRLREVVGGGEMATGSGNIRGQGVEGGFSLSTGSGNISLYDAKLTGDTKASTGSGTVEIVLGAQLDYDLSLSTGSGNAILDFNGHKIEGDFRMKASDSDDIRAPFDFEEDYDDDSRGRRGRGNRVKTAKVGKKDVQIRISSGSGRAMVKK